MPQAKGVHRMKRNLLMSLALSLVSSVALGTTLPQMTQADAPTQAATAEAEVGKQAPDFSLTDADGKSHKLSDYKGKFIVLEWVNFGCPFVKKHYGSGNMQKLQEAYTKQGVVWLSICSSAQGKQGFFEGKDLKKEIADHHNKSTAYLIDADGKVGKEYGAKTTPDMFIIDKHNELVYAGAIDDKPTPDLEDIAGAKNYVKLVLDEALSGKKIATASNKSYGCSVKYAN
jgi:peroxiredoxin